MFFFFNDTATTEIYTLSLHDALPIFRAVERTDRPSPGSRRAAETSGRRLLPTLLSPLSTRSSSAHSASDLRSEEHTSELQSRQYLVCRLLLEKKNNYHLRHVQNSTIF